MPQLISPDAKYRASYAEALREGLHLQPAKEEDILLVGRDFDAYMKKRHNLNIPVTLPDGRKVERLPQIDFWLVEGERFLGMTSIRPQLNEYLRKRGGNIGYAVRASERRKGYGSLILTLALAEAAKLGLKEVLITCHDQNIGSAKIIESHGGVFQDKITLEGLPLPERRYKINL